MGKNSIVSIDQTLYAEHLEITTAHYFKKKKEKERNQF